MKYKYFKRGRYSSWNILRKKVTMATNQLLNNLSYRGEQIAIEIKKFKWMEDL